MNDVSNISIIGLGLIGGSLAKALKRVHPDLRIAGMDVNSVFMESALSECIIDSASDCLSKVIESAKIIFLCTPVTNILDLIDELASLAPDGTIITDTGSTKFEIMERAQKVLPKSIHFIGGHPMTGSEHSGYSSSLPHLFENAYYILTPNSTVNPDNLNLLASLVSDTGAIPIVTDANLHDHVVGSISHLPHVLAASLVNTVSEADDPQQFRLKLAAGGFKDITRIASSNPKIWRDISFSNKKHLSDLIRSTIEGLNSFNRWLEEGDSAKIEYFFASAKKYRDQLKTEHIPSITSYNELYIDIEDRPGLLGKITTILGDNNINIKNLRIIHSREDDPEGCLVVSFANSDEVITSKKVLSDSGFKSYDR